MADPWSELARFREDTRLLAPLLAVNLGGLVFGYYYYWQVGQFDPSSRFYQPPWTWPLVADSPNAVLLFMVATAASRWAGWRSRWLDAAAFVLNVYVGLWTTALFLLYPDRMGTFAWASVPGGNANPVLFVAHMGMPLQALVLVRDLRRDAWGWLPLAAFAAGLLVYVAVDYAGPVLHPAPFLHPGDAALHAVSPVLMLAAFAAWAVLARPLRGRGARGSPPP